MFKNYYHNLIWTFTGPKTYINFSRQKLITTWLFFASSICLLIMVAFSLTWLSHKSEIRTLPSHITNQILASLPNDAVITWSNSNINTSFTTVEVDAPASLNFLVPANQPLLKIDTQLDAKTLESKTSGPLIVVTKNQLSILSGYYQSQTLSDFMPASDLKISKPEIANYGLQAQTWWNKNIKVIILGYLFTLIIVTLISHTFIIFLDSLMIWGLFWLIKRQAYFRIILKWSFHIAVVAKTISIFTSLIPQLVPLSYTNCFWTLWAGMMIWLWYQRLGWSK